MREICLDIETTGLEPKNGHKIIEIACVELVNKVKTGNNFHSYINPRRDVPDEAFRIHGISTKFLQDKPIFDHVAHKFLEFISDSVIVIHNAAFDTKFLNHELKILNLETMNMSLVVDSLLMARAKFPGAQNSLDGLCKRFNIDLSKRSKHGALLDAELLADVYIELLGGAQATMFEISNNNGKNFSNKSIDQNLNQNTAATQDYLTNKSNFSNLEKRDFALSEEEIKLHQEFIVKNFKTNLWGY
jgi:DNA polymerase-3 subunit epsilon